MSRKGKCVLSEVLEASRRIVLLQELLFRRALLIVEGKVLPGTIELFYITGEVPEAAIITKVILTARLDSLQSS